MGAPPPMQMNYVEAGMVAPGDWPRPKNCAAQLGAALPTQRGWLAHLACPAWPWRWLVWLALSVEPAQPRRESLARQVGNVPERQSTFNQNRSSSRPQFMHTIPDAI